MILRVVAAICVTLVGVFILYLPAAHPPERFLDQLRVEHDLNARFWGPEPALRIMERMLDLRDGAKQSSPISSTLTNAPRQPALDVALAKQMTQMTDRLFHNPYFKSIDTLLVLAAYRLAAFLEWLPLLAGFILAAWCDGLIRRVVKGKEFSHHSPEAYGLHILLIVVILCATVVAFVVPVTLHPLVLALVPVAVGVSGSFAIANFHYRG